jgi:hypothetical protein
MKFRFYKEPTILISALLIGFLVIIYVLATPQSSTDATVDNVVPLPLQLNKQSEQTETPQSTSQSTSIESSNPFGGLNQ